MNNFKFSVLTCLVICLFTFCSEKHKLPLYSGEQICNKEGIHGMLYSQVGYETGKPVRVMVRMPLRDDLSDKVYCQLSKYMDKEKLKSDCKYWGKVWGSHWWVAEFNITDSSRWDVEVYDKGKLLFNEENLNVGKDILWNKTVKYSSVHILDRRNLFSKNGAGWMDAGAMWFESPAQSAMLFGLEDLIENSKDCFDTTFVNKIYHHITIGCDYFPILQDKAKELGFPIGSMSHDVYGHENDVLLNDATKALVAMYRAINLLPDTFVNKKTVYKKTADLAYNWLLNEAKPEGNRGFSHFQRGINDTIVIPKDEWQTRDLMMFLWASVEKCKTGDNEAQEIAVKTAREIMSRQITKVKSENGYYGHFREYNSLTHSEKSWSHNPLNAYGADLGGTLPNYLMPFFEMIEIWSSHEDVEKWKNTLLNFAYGYLIPVCEKNPFKIVPLGIFGEEGPIWFAGQFHGTNSIYGFTAAISLELAKMFNEPKLADIAYCNLQWISGLNSGITKANIALGCDITHNDVPEGIALPASMINGIGNRTVGTWFNTKGVICNGFAASKQFRPDKEPKVENDIPMSFTDEEWLPHVGGWLAGISRLNK